MTKKEFNQYKNGERKIDVSKQLRIELFESQIMNEIKIPYCYGKSLFSPDVETSPTKLYDTRFTADSNEVVKIEFKDDKVIVTKRHMHFWIDSPIKDIKGHKKSNLVGEQITNEFERENVKIIQNF